MNLSEHFTLAELSHSDVSTRRGIDNTPTGALVENLKMVAAKLEQVRDVLNVPIIVNSGYRSPAVNRAVGGSIMSAHCDGLAADFIAPGFGTPQEVARAIISAGIKFDQLIYEGTWVHLSVAPKMRQQVLTAHFGAGPATYTAGIA